MLESIELPLIFLFAEVIIIWSYFSVKKGFLNRNKEFLSNARKVKARIYEVRNHVDTGGYYKSIGDVPLTKMSYFVGRRVNISNSAIVEILDTGELIQCTFIKLATLKNYPSVFNAYVGVINGRKECYSEDYFTKGLKPLRIIVFGFAAVLLLVALIIIFVNFL